MKALAPFRGLLAVGCLIVAGCSTPKTDSSRPEYSSWQPYLLYSLSAPHPRLVVEVDAVEGAEPDQARLDRLRQFLAAHCHKPGGIELVRGDVIPRATARGVSPNALARHYLNGPPENASAPPPAFLYVLFYDQALSNKRVGKSPGHLPNPKNPHVDLLPYPSAIFINTRFGPKTIWNEILEHEAGHVLGLVGRSNYAAGYHCLDEDCMMNSSFRFHIGRFISGRDPFIQRQLCPRCEADLSGRAFEPPPANLRFVGPVLVRSEAGYHVLSLPFRAKIVLGDLTDQDCRNFANATRSEPLVPGGNNYDYRVDGLVKDELLGEPPSDAVLARARLDPLEAVRVAAPRIWAQSLAQRYYGRGQFTNAVAACRRAACADSQDVASFNLLAWIEATCPDPSARNGRDAVSAATKACELSQWHDGGLIDTLAAAWAEAGDFKRAIQFQEQALRTGDPGEPARKEMQARLSLYHQSQPFREPGSKAQ